MIIFSPTYPEDFLPKGAPRIAIIDDRARRGWRLICQLITEAGGEVVVIPRTVSDYFMIRSGLKNDVIQTLKTKCDALIANNHNDFLAKMRTEHLAEVQKKIASVDAVILPGNEYDIPPSAYGETEIHVKTVLASSSDFRFETECLMARYALDNEIPMLGVCGGMQLLVALTGGKLAQHLPDILKTQENIHTSCIKDVSEQLLQWMECDYSEFLDNPYKPCPIKTNHPVSITDDETHLARIAYQHFGTLAVCDNPVLGVFSIHHQGALPHHINTQELKVTAVAPDGIVEAVEHISHRYCIATQFHPEFDVRGLALPLMKELITHCKK